jgi:outer membrane protein assembly factor BamB
LNNGSLKWSIDFDHFSHGSPAIGPDGTIYIAPETNLFAISQDGEIIWRHGIGYGAASTPALSADNIIVVYGSNDTLYFFNKDGSINTTYPTPSNSVGWLKWGAAPAIGPGGTIFVGSVDKCLYAIENKMILPSIPIGLNLSIGTFQLL